ncbi:hypothetical protein BVC93_24330 [Mycobacterium sp. MS1601]|uniref:DUF2339 domain-containing protein n=1 Tax=Mycobacterium sp. MS1601 TaxID=1936029 RepID=UPI000979530D|nr:DUF2339 domain-containing protein [Mycobacterium sp. MS1601]AQA05012.1 hypothetical protein BVC93_24330 [Mycobacterium sp. MS1601]
MSQPHQTALARLSEEFTALSQQVNRVAAQLAEVERTMGVPAAPPPPVAAPTPYYPPPPAYPYPYPVPAPVAFPPSPRPLPPPVAAKSQPREGWIGKLLAVAGVAVTLIGVVLLLVLAAQAGLLAPGVRVAAGGMLAAALVAGAVVFNRRDGGRVGAIALAATGIAAAYMDVVAVTTIYDWVPPVAGLVLASLIGGGGLTLARRWNSEHLAVLVLVPLAVLAPIVADGVTVLLIGFMLVLSAASLPVQVGKDWVLMHAARVAAVTLPLLLALLVASFDTDQNTYLLGGACGIAALLSIISALVLLPGTSRPVGTAVLAAIGVVPALAAAVAVEQLLAVLLSAAVAAVMLAIVMLHRRLPGVTSAVVAIWATVSAVAAVVTVTVAFEGYVEAPVFLALAVVLAVAGRHSALALWAATAFTTLGVLVYTVYAPPGYLVEAAALPVPEALSVLAASVLLIAAAVALSWTAARTSPVIPAVALAVSVYGVTTFTVTFGVLVGGSGGGFLAGHMAATICWVAMAAVLLWHAQRIVDRDARTAPIVAGLALTAAATAKLLLFDLGTLDGMFRVVVFIVVGLVLLAMGAGYAKSLARTDSADSQQRDASPTVTE